MARSCEQIFLHAVFASPLNALWLLRRACHRDSQDHASAHRACRYNTDPSGMYVRHEARAIGSGSEGAQSALEEGYRCASMPLALATKAEPGRTHLSLCCMHGLAGQSKHLLVMLVACCVRIVACSMIDGVRSLCIAGKT